jgi:hypothetical protein
VQCADRGVAEALLNWKVAMPLLALAIYFAIHALANILYLELTGLAVQEAADRVNAAPLWIEGPLQNQLVLPCCVHDSHTQRAPPKELPPFFLVFALNACLSVAAQSVSTMLVFSVAHVSIFRAYCAFGAILLLGSIVPFMAMYLPR